VPKSIIFTNAVLLACLSMLASSGVMSLFGGEVAFGRCGIAVLSITGLICAAIMALTEILTGISWVPVVALASLVVGWVAVDGPTVTRASEIAWAVGWLSVAVWFAYLAARARENRW
jgi:hypothetical protein